MKVSSAKVFIIISITLISVIISLSYVGEIHNKFKRHIYGVSQGVTLEGVDMSYWLESEVENHIINIAKELKREPRNAFIDKNSGEIFPEVKGRIVNVRSTVNSILFAELNEEIKLKTIYIDPEITKELLEKLTVEIGSFSTYLGSGSNRVENIRVATNSLNYYLMAPGQVFSFNNTTGARTVEKGYKLAPIIVGGSVVPGLGGGICQVSTTLFNAVEKADLQVVERYLHSKPIGYVPRGRDATVSDHLDFKFGNNSNKYILIEAWTDYRINVKILTH